MLSLRSVFCSVAAALLAVGIFAAAFADELVTIGTGGVTGGYYPADGAICRLVNRGRKPHGIRCSVESTGGSIYNFNTIAAGELDMGAHSRIGIIMSGMVSASLPTRGRTRSAVGVLAACRVGDQADGACRAVFPVAAGGVFAVLAGFLAGPAVLAAAVAGGESD